MKRPQAISLMTDDATWWVPRKGTPPWTKAELVKYMAAADRVFNNEPTQVTIIGVTAERDRVAVEAEGYARVINGKIYNNIYHFLIRSYGDAICEVKEYLDSKHVEEAFEGVPSPTDA